MANEKLRTNQGYTIIASVSLPNEEYVLGEKKNSINDTKYVTWCYVNGTDFYYGHYIDDKDQASKDMYERAQKEIEYRISQLERKINEKGGKKQ